MITPLQVYRAKRTWGVGWFVAWTRLRARREYWKPPRVDPTYLVHPARDLTHRR